MPKPCEPDLRSLPNPESMSDTELLDLLESGKVEIADITRSGKGDWLRWKDNRYYKEPSLRDCIRKLAELNK